MLRSLLKSPTSYVLRDTSLIFRNIKPASRSVSTVECPANKNNESVSDVWENAKTYSDIPGPKAYPIVGNTWRFLPMIGEYHGAINDIYEFFNRLRREYGDIIKLEGIIGQPDMVYLFKPEDIEKIYKSEAIIPERDILPSMSYFRKHMRQDIFKDAKGLVTSHGQDWYDFRSKVNSIMMQPKVVKQYINPVDKITRELVKKIKKIRGPDNKVSVDILKEINKWSLESITYVALNLRLNCLANDLPEDSIASKLIKLTNDVFLIAAKLDFEPSFWLHFTTPTFKKGMKVYNEQVTIIQVLINKAMEEINKNKELGIASDPNAELSVLEKLLKIDTNVAIVMTLDMLIAGVDTTSASLVNILYYLATNPVQQEKLRGEIIQLLPQKKSKLTIEHLNQMLYLKACIKESMRLYPVTPGTMRILTKDTLISGYRIPKGTEVLFPHLHLSVRDDQFIKPDKFIPERWLRSNIDTDISYKNAHPFSSLPFGFGSRSCIGRRFADLELEVAVVNFMRNFNLSWDGPVPKKKTTTINYLTGPFHFIFENNDIILNGDMACINNKSIPDYITADKKE